MNLADFPRYHYAANVTRVIDGDTIECLLDLGDRTYRTRRIRILGYDAPEIVGASHLSGLAAKLALEAIIPVGSRVYIATQLDRTSFDRLLGWVYAIANDDDLYEVSQAMIAGGHHVPKDQT